MKFGVYVKNADGLKILVAVCDLRGTAEMVMESVAAGIVHAGGDGITTVEETDITGVTFGTLPVLS